MDSFEKILKFVLRERGRYKKTLTRETTLEKDLKISGEDSDEFIEAFGREFNVEISQLDLSKHFVSEGSFALFKLILFGIDTGKTPITLGDLEKAIKKENLSNQSQTWSVVAQLVRVIMCVPCKHDKTGLNINHLVSTIYRSFDGCVAHQPFSGVSMK